MRASERSRRASSAVVVYVIVLVAFQVFLITVAVEAFLTDEETLACLHALASALWAVGRRHEARRVLGDATRTAYEALRAEHELTQGMLADYAAMTSPRGTFLAAGEVR